jgi:CRP-like cAMP-binding protein
VCDLLRLSAPSLLALPLEFTAARADLFEHFILPPIRFLCDLPAPTKRALAQIMVVQYCSTGETVFRQGDVGDRICFLAAGAVGLHGSHSTRLHCVTA